MGTHRILPGVRVWEQEPMRVAVIQTHKVRPCIPHITDAPQEVVLVDDGVQGGLQVVGLSAMDAVLGRITRFMYRKVGGQRYINDVQQILFDPSMGSLRA
jgi:hypothetical protein